jgi:putrescine transport system substrate-binding protein
MPDIIPGPDRTGKTLESTMRLVLLVCLMVAVCAGARAQEKVVNVYNWTDYIDPAAIERFQKATGIHVRYDEYDSLETLEGKLLAGSSGYDVVVPTAEPTLSRLIRDKALLPLDPAKIPNSSNLDPKLMQLVAKSDPGNRYARIYLWGTVGLGELPDKIAALAPGAPTDSWDLLFKPENAKLLAPCGITMMDSAIDVIPSVLKYLGHDPNSTQASDLADVERTLMGIRPYIRNFASSGALEAMADGETCLVFDYSGDVIQAAARAQEAGNAKVEYVAPREGAELWFDTMAIPKDAPHPDAAYQFINFMLQPEVMAGVTNTVRYADAIPAAMPMVDKAIADNPNIYPPMSAFAHFFTTSAVPQAAERARSRMWAHFKAGS